MSNDPFAWFWMAMIALSVAWYAFLLFWLGIKGGHEIVRMTRVLSERPVQKEPGEPTSE